MTRDRQDEGLPVALVVGATGRQGGSVARHLLAGGRFRVRALTRQPSSDEARTLAALGAEVVAGDLSDRGSLRAALRGVDALFGMTDWWEHFEGELAQGIALVDAARAARVRHVVLSTQPSVAVRTGGRRHSAEFDTKALVEAHARAVGLPATFVHVAFYWENLLSLFLPRLQPDGSLQLAIPMAGGRLAGIGEDDIGGAVAAILAAGAPMIGRTVRLVGDARRVDEIAHALSVASGRTVRAHECPTRAPWARVPGAEALGEAFTERFAAYQELQDGLDAAIAETRALFAPTRDLAAWADAHAHEFRWVFHRLGARTSHG